MSYEPLVMIGAFVLSFFVCVRVWGFVFTPPLKVCTEDFFFIVRTTQWRCESQVTMNNSKSQDRELTEVQHVKLCVL